MQKFGLGNTGYNQNNIDNEVIKIKEEINSLGISTKEKVLSLFGALLISLALFSGLITFVFNMLIYYDLYPLFGFILYIILVVGIYLTNYIYLVGITKNQVKDIKKICNKNLGIYMIVLGFLFLLLFSGGY